MTTDDEWPTLLRTGYGNVFALGRWTHASTHLIAAAVNSGDWSFVTTYAERCDDWDEQTAC